MRSFIGAYEFLSRVPSGCAAAIAPGAPLDNAIAGMSSQDKLTGSEELADSFTRAQKHLQSHKSTVKPC